MASWGTNLGCSGLTLVWDRAWELQGCGGVTKVLSKDCQKQQIKASARVPGDNGVSPSQPETPLSQRAGAGSQPALLSCWAQD